MKRAFTKTAKEKVQDNHGGARMRSLYPDVYAKGVKSLDLVMSFDEALKLEKSITSGTLALNRLDRNTVAGRKRNLCLTILIRKNGTVDVGVRETDTDGRRRQALKTVAA